MEQLSRCVVRIAVIFSFVLTLGACVRGQTDPTIEPGILNNRTYEVGQFDSINPMNGNLVIRIPLVAFPQKGSLKLSFSLTAQSAGAWYSTETCNPNCVVTYGRHAFPQVLEDSELLPLASTTGGLSEGVTLKQRITAGTGGSSNFTNLISTVDSSGTQHTFGYDNSNWAHLRTTDGSGYLFVPTNPSLYMWNNGGYIAGVIYQPDGVARTYGTNGIVNGIAVPGLISIADPNGNKISYSVTASSSTYVDSVNRTIPDPQNLKPTSSSTVGCPAVNAQFQPLVGSQAWVVPGLNGGTQTFLFCFASINVSTNSGNNPFTLAATVIQSIVLPNGTYWALVYDSANPSSTCSFGSAGTCGYGDVLEVVTPTGGTVNYAYITNTGFCNTHTEDVIRSVTTRSVNAGNGASTWSYSYTYPSTQNNAYSVRATDPYGSYTVYNYQSAVSGACVNEEVSRQSYSSTGILMRTVSTSYLSTTSNPQAVLTPAVWETAIGLLPQTITTTLENGQATSTTYAYDPGFMDGQPVCNIATNGTTTCSSSGGFGPQAVSFGRRTDEKIVDYGGAVLRDTKTSYQWQSNSGYLAANLIDLPCLQTVYGPGSFPSQTSCSPPAVQANQVAQTGFGYDENNGSPQGIFGNRTSQTRWYNAGTSPKSQTVFNVHGMPTSKIDPLGNTTTISYDSTGLYPNTIQYPSTSGIAHTESYAYDANTGVPTSHTDQNSQTTTYGYDSSGRLTSTTYPAEGGQETYCYSDEGGPSCSASPLPLKITTTKKINSSINVVTSENYDGFGRQVQSQLVSDPDGATSVETTYDAFGRVVTKSNPHRAAASSTDGLTTYYYDGLGRVCLTVPPDGTLPSSNPCASTKPSNTILTSYTGNQTTVSDQANHTRTSTSDGLGRTIQIIESSLYESDYAYDPLGNVTCIAQKGTNSGTFTSCGATPTSWRPRVFTYDSLSRLTSSSNPESNTVTSTGTRLATSFNYDANGNLLSKVEPAPNQTGSGTQTISFCYDALNRLKSKAFTQQSCPMTAPVFAYSYDQGSTGANPIGRMTGMTDPAGSENWSYDAMGRATLQRRTTDNVNMTTAYTYNFDGSLATVTYPSGRTITYTYGPAGRAFSATDQDNSIIYATGATYAPQGGLSELALGLRKDFGGITLLRTYNNRLQTASVRGMSASVDSLELVYCYSCAGGNNGNLGSITNNLDNTRSVSFSYDALDRLQTAQTQTTGVTIPNSNCWGFTFGYDPWGNLLSSSITGPAGCSEPIPFSVTANAANQISAYCYDSAGNLLLQASCPSSNPAYTYTYDAENRLTNFNSGGYTYAYDGDNRRVQKTNSSGQGTLYWYDVRGNIITETDAAGNLTNEYVYFNGERISRQHVTQACPSSNSQTQYYLTDSIQSSRVVTDSSGNILDNSDFYPFGGERDIVSASGSTYKFTGKERDAETSNDYFGSRYYSSISDRFLSVDPVVFSSGRLQNPQQLNLYTYVANNPLRYIDPTGEILIATGDLKKDYFDLCLLAGDACDNRLKIDDKTGVVSFDTKDLDLSTNEGAKLLNDLITSKNTYEFSEGPTMMTDKGPIKLAKQEDLALNLPAFRNQGKSAQPRRGVSDVVGFYFENRKISRRSNTKLGTALDYTYVFHELAEAFEKIDGGKGDSYEAGHNAALEREMTLRDQRPYLKEYNTGAGGPANSKAPEGTIVVKP